MKDMLINKQILIWDFLLFTKLNADYFNRNNWQFLNNERVYINTLKDSIQVL